MFMIKTGKKLKETALGPVLIPAQPDNMPPLDTDVIRVLRNAVGLE